MPSLRNPESATGFSLSCSATLSFSFLSILLVSVFITNKTNILIFSNLYSFMYSFSVPACSSRYITLLPVHLLWASASSSRSNTATVWNCSVETVSLYCYSTILLQFRIIMYKQYYYITTVWNHKVATVSLYCYSTILLQEKIVRWKQYHYTSAVQCLQITIM